MADSSEGNKSYDTDFSAWALDQAQRLRDQQAAVPGLDLARLAEEVDALAKHERIEAKESAIQLVAGNLAVPAGRDKGVSWRVLERWQELQWEGHWYLEEILDASPSIRPAIEAAMAQVNDSGRNQAALWFYRCGLEPPDFSAPAYTLDDLLVDPLTHRQGGEG